MTDITELSDAQRDALTSAIHDEATGHHVLHGVPKMTIDALRNRGLVSAPTEDPDGGYTARLLVAGVRLLDETDVPTDEPSTEPTVEPGPVRSRRRVTARAFASREPVQFRPLNQPARAMAGAYPHI